MLKKVAVFAVFFISVAQVTMAQDVQVLLRPKMDPMPPQVMNYIGNPGTYFDVSLTNTTDEVQNVFLTLEVSKQTGGELSVTTPYYVQPNKAITLVPKRLTTVDQVTLLGQFRQLLPKDITLKGAEVSDFYDNGVVGLLPEGTYQAQVKVYKWDPAIKYPQLVSDPLQGKCTFSVCYNASAPEILVPLYNPLELRANALGISKRGIPGMASDDNDAKWQPAILDPVKAQFVWKTPVINCGGKVRSYKYQLDIFPIGTTQTSAEEAVATGTIAKTVKNLVAAQCILSEAEVAQMTKFSPTGYFVARVTATPTVTDKNNVDYSTIENNGHSQLLVFRLKQVSNGKNDKKDDKKEVVKDDEEVQEEKMEDEKEEVDPGYKEPEKNDDKEYVYYPPKLTAPTPFKGNVIKADGDIKLTWEKPEKKSGGDEPLNFSYNVQVFKKKASQSIDSLLVSKPIFEEKSLTATNFTVRWNDIKEKVKLNDNLVIAVVPVCLNESSVGYDNEDERNLYRGSYVTSETGKLIDCDPDASKSITNRTIGKFSEKELRDMEVMVGQFPLTIENANLVDGDHYEGRGYITWKPMGDLPFQINVTFNKLYINSDKIVYDGEVVSAKEEEKNLNDYIPYDMFDDLFLADLVGAGTASAYGEKLFQYIEDDQKMAKYCKYAREVAPILDDIIKQKVSVNLPVSLTKLIPTCPVDIQIMSGRWSPTNASVSIIGMFAMPESKYTDSQVAVFGLPRLCIEPDSFVPTGCTMALLSDFYIKDPNTQFVFTLKAPSDLQKMDDGCSISFTNKGFQEMNFEADMEIPGLIKADEKGERLKGQRPHIDIKAKIKDWDNWVGQLKMDNFEVEEAPGFTFIPSGDGLIYDHSLTDNGKGFKFPEPMTPKGGIDKNYKPKTYDKKKVGINSDKENVKWQGLYLDKIGCWLPPVFKQGDGNNRIEVAMKQFLWDDSGVSLTISAAGTNGGDLVGIETGKLGGWGISLHEVGVSVVQNDFGCTYFTGMLKTPLIGGKWNYSTSFDKIDKGAGGSDLRILFHMQPDGDPEFDFLLAKVALDEKYTHLDVQYTNSDKETKVELEMAGHITISGTEEVTKNLDLDISGVAFTGMRVANFAKPKESNNRSEAQAIKYSHTFDPICEGPKCWFEMGTWGLASAEKTLGPFKFSLDNFGIDKKDDLVGVNIMGTVGLVNNVFSATAGVTIWAKVDLNKLDIDYEKTTLDKIGLSTEFGGCKVAGSLEFVDKNEKGLKVKGYAGTLEFVLPGDLIKMQAAGGFYNAEDTQHGRFTSAYFLAEVGGATGIPIGPVQLNNISGGFFFHTSLDMASVEANENNVSKWKTTVKYGVHGGMFGLGIATSGTDRGLNAKVRMTVLYDAVKNRLSTFRMTGDMHALCAPGAEDGMINAKCCIVYQNLPTSEGGKYFQINITADAGGDMDKLYEQFTGQKLELPDVTAGLQEFSDKSDKKSKDAGDSKPKVSCGVSISIDFKVTMKADDAPANFKPKWHLYVGQPGDGSASSLAKDRCSITFIDFQVGSKKGKVAAWCKEWANAYLCVGNELPNNGELPPIPQEIDEFLNGSKRNDKIKESSTNRSADVNNKRKQATSQFSGAAKSGVMFGAQVGGNWGVRAVICYAEATLLAGFDIVLKQLEDAQCNGKPAGGKGGFYGMGQVYAMAKGEMGLIIDIWIYKGDWSLIDVGVGAVLKGGFPNPSWLYGKVKATCKLFGGLIKFNGSLTFELGDVCFPDAGNPLDDIKIFEDMTPGEEHTGSASATPSGWKSEAISIYAPAGFTTNMKIGTRLDLVDENTANRMAGKDGDPAEYYTRAMRSYKFYLKPTGKFESWTDINGKNNTRTDNFSYRSSDMETFEYVISGGSLEANRYYKVTQEGYAKEIRNGKEVNPYYKKSGQTEEKSQPWEDLIIRYFHTGSYPNNLKQNIKFILPQQAGTDRWYINEMKKPQFHLNTERGKNPTDDIFNTSKYDIVARFEKYVDGAWVPADAKMKLDTYSAGSGVYYRVDENGNVDYTTKVDKNGNTIATQCDPFAKNKKTLYGVNIERLQRYTAELSDILKEGSMMVGESKAPYYLTLKWIPEDLNSLSKELDYYLAIMNTDKNYSYMINNGAIKVKKTMSSLITEVNSLKTKVLSSAKTTYPSPVLDDMRYTYQNTLSEKTSINNQYKLLYSYDFKTYFEKSLNSGAVYIPSVKTAYRSRENLTLKNYKEHLDTLSKRKSRAMSAMQKAFRNGPGSARLNEMKQIYVKLDEAYESAKKHYGYAQTISTNYESAKTTQKNMKVYMGYIRSPKYTLSSKKSYLTTLQNTKKNSFDSWEKNAMDNYPDYYVSKQLVLVCEAYSDSVAELTKYVKFLENNATVNTKATELETLLKNVNAYLEKTPDASRSYSYVKSNYYSKAISAFNAAQKATNHGSDFERAKTAYNAIESAIFSSEKLALEYAKEQKTASNTAFNKAKTAATDALSAVNAVIAEQKKTSSSNDNAASIQKLRDTEEKKFADAYNKANDVADIAADVQRYTARHTGELSQSSNATQMRQIVADCKTNAEGAMTNYKNAVATAETYRMKVYRDKASTALYYAHYYFDKMIGVTNTSSLKSYASSVASYAQAAKDATEVLQNMNDKHIYYTTAFYMSELANYCKSGANYIASNNASDWSLVQASYYFYMIAQRAEVLTRGLVFSGRNTNDETFASVMSGYAEKANTSIKKITLSNKATSNQKSTLTTRKTDTSTYTNKAKTNAANRKGQHLVMETDPVSLNGMGETTPLYAAVQYRSTVPGVAEAHELALTEIPTIPEIPETPDGPAGAAVIAKVAGMMNASLPMPKPKPTVPAKSVINNASAMLNGGTYSSFSTAGEAPIDPEAPAVPDVSGVPAYDPYSSATSTLKSAYTSAGKTSSVTKTSSGAITHIDPNSIANSKQMSIPVKYYHSRYTNGKPGGCHWLELTGLDMYSTIMQDNGYKKYNYRIVIMQVDKQKFQQFQQSQIASHKEYKTTTENATLDSSNKSYLSSTSKKSGADNTSDAYNLQAYMAEYYKEMREQGLNKAEGTESETKLDTKKVSDAYKNFTNEIYNVEFNRWANAVFYKDFSTWANNNRNADGSAKYKSGSKYYLDNQLEGVRSINFKYYITKYDPDNMVGKSDNYLMNIYNDYVLKDPYVWLAYMGGFALFNGRTVAKKSSYWDSDWYNPQTLAKSSSDAYIKFHDKSAAYRGKYNGVAQTSYSIPYTNAGVYMSGTQWNGYMYAPVYKNYEVASNFISWVAVGFKYCQPSYNDTRAEKIQYDNGAVFTGINAIKDMLIDMHSMAYDLQYYYRMLYDRKAKTIKSEIASWGDKRAGSYGIRCPAYQAGFLYQSKWLNDNNKGSKEFLKYFPGYESSRYNKVSDQVALGIDSYGGTNYQFQYKWYCNNMKSVDTQFFRCNAYDVNYGEYTVFVDDYSQREFTKTMTWSTPLKGFCDSGFGLYWVPSTWK